MPMIADDAWQPVTLTRKNQPRWFLQSHRGRRVSVGLSGTYIIVEATCIDKICNFEASYIYIYIYRNSNVDDRLLGGTSRCLTAHDLSS